MVTLDLATNEQRVETTGAGEKWSPHWTSDGGRIGDASGGPEGGVEFVTGTAGARGEVRSAGWSNDGQRVVFHRDDDARWPPVREWPTLDRTFRLVRTGIFASSTSAGDRLFMNDGVAGNRHNSILAMDPYGSRHAILLTDSVRSALGPALSPGGDRIAFGLGGFFQGVNRPAIVDIAVMRADGSDVRILTDGSANVGMPSWSRDGRRIVYRAWIVFASARAGFKDEAALLPHNPQPYGDLYVMRADGSDVRRLTDNQFEEGTPGWIRVPVREARRIRRRPQ